MESALSGGNRREMDSLTLFITMTLNISLFYLSTLQDEDGSGATSHYLIGLFWDIRLILFLSKLNLVIGEVTVKVQGNIFHPSRKSARTVTVFQSI